MNCRRSPHQKFCSARLAAYPQKRRFPENPENSANDCCPACQGRHERHTCLKRRPLVGHGLLMDNDFDENDDPNRAHPMDDDDDDDDVGLCEHGNGPDCVECKVCRKN